MVMERVRIACQCERPVTMVETQTVFLVAVFVVMSHDAVAAFHGTRTVVEPVVFVHEIERTDVRHVSNRLFETVEKFSLAVSVLARVLQRELDDLGDVQTPLNSSEVDDETPCGFVFVDRGVYAVLALDQLSPCEPEHDRVWVQPIKLQDWLNEVYRAL